MTPPDPTTEQLLREGKALRALAHGLLANAADVEDVVQDASIAALAPGQRRLGPWLSGTVRHLAAMLRRSQARRRARERLVALPELDAASDPAAIATQSELLRDVAAAVHELDEPFRTVVVLRFWRGLLPEAIAERLGVPRNTVRSRLQRGLERLRARLDGRYGKRESWSAPLGAVVAWRPAAPVVVGAAGVTWIVGWIMQTKLWLGAGAVLLAAVAIPLSLHREQAMPAPGVNAPAPTPVAAEIAPPELQRREVVTATHPGAAAATVAPTRDAPWSTSFLVTDEDDRPVADATISVWPMHPKGRMAFEGEPLQRLHTASDGTVDAVFACDVRAVAAKDLGASTVAWLNAAKDAGNQTVLVLQPTVLQRGTVRRSDGTPAFGATVRINVQGFNSLQRGMAPEPAALQTDADGRFAVRLQKFAPYAIDAVLDGKQTFRDGLQIRTDDPPDLLLTFPGAITVRGLVIDPDGRPVANARVSCWREYHLEDPGQDADDMETCGEECGTDGSFALELRQYRRYQLIASAPGFANSAVLWIEPTVVHAHAEVRLPLLLPASIHGIVLHDDGSPFAGVSVMATPEAGTASLAIAVPSREAMFGSSPAGRTDAEGRFAFAVHPGTQWKLQVWPVRGSRAICYARPHVAADGTEVEWRISDAQLAGCRVRGTVMRADDGLPLARFGVRLVALDDADAETVTSLPSEQAGGQFELCLPLGRRCAIEILPGPGASPGASWPDDPELAPVRTEPFTTTSLERQFAVRVPDWATVPLRILSAEGAPAHDVRATVQTNGVFRPRKVTRTDRDGRLVLDHCVPGTAMLMLWRGMTKVGEQQVVLTPGLNPELGVLLVAATAPR